MFPGNFIKLFFIMSAWPNEFICTTFIIRQSEIFSKMSL